MVSDSPPTLARRLGPKLAISLALGGLLAWVSAQSGVPTVPRAAAFASVTWWAVPAYAVCLLFTHVIRAVRWRHLIAPVKRLPLGEVILLNWVGFFAIFALPMRLGEMVRPALTKLRERVPISVGFGTIAVERVVDGLVASLCLAWALVALPHLPTSDPIASRLPAVGTAAVALFAAAFIALGVFVWKRTMAVRLTERAIGWASPRLSRMVAEKVGNLADGIRSIGDVRLLGAFLLETGVYWGSNAFGMWVLAVGCGIPAHIGHGVAVMGVLAIGILLPAGPGLFGSFQLAVAAGLRLYFPESVVATEGAVYIFLMYGVQAVTMVLTGAVPMYFMDVRLRDLLSPGVEVADGATLAGDAANLADERGTRSLGPDA